MDSIFGEYETVNEIERAAYLKGLRGGTSLTRLGHRPIVLDASNLQQIGTSLDYKLLVPMQP